MLRITDITNPLSTIGHTIKGRISAGTGDPEDLTPANVRSIIGQKWVSVFDTTLASAVTSIDVDLLGLSEFRIVLSVTPNPAVANFICGWRSSTNGGVSYDSGASDYHYELLTQTGTTVAGANGNGSIAFLHLAAIDTASAVFDAKSIMQFSRGTASRWPRMDSKISLFDGTSSYQSLTTTYRTAVGPVTHLRLLAGSANGLGIGTRLIVEGC